MRAAYRYISADSHLEIPPDRWTRRVPSQYRDRAPRVIHLPDGSQGIICENQPLHTGGSDLVAGRPFEEWHPNRLDYENATGAGSPERRLIEQDMDGIDAEVLFASVSCRRLWNHIADNDAYYAVLQAYNEFVAEEYCAVAPDRLISVGIIPERGLDEAIAELEHCKKLGFQSVCLGRFPNGRLYPVPEDDRFWAAAIDLDMPLTIHTALTEDDGGRATRGAESIPAVGVARRSSAYTIRGAPAVVQMAVGGVFERFPRLQIYLAENQYGWVPNCIEQTDIMYRRHHPWRAKHQGFVPLPNPPSYYLKNHCLWGFIDNPIGVQLRHYVGVDKLLWSNDMPHAPTDWPNSQEVIARNFAGVPEDEKYLMVAGNAIRLFHLEQTFETTEAREQQVATRRAEFARDPSHA